MVKEFVDKQHLAIKNILKLIQEHPRSRVISATMKQTSDSGNVITSASLIDPEAFTDIISKACRLSTTYLNFTQGKSYGHVSTEIVFENNIKSKLQLW